MGEDDDLLGQWLFIMRERSPADSAAARAEQPRVHDALERLSRLLETGEPLNDRTTRALGLPYSAGFVALAPADVPLAQDLYRRVSATRGARRWIQDTLLDLIAVTEDPASIPFWRALLDLTQSRDQYTPRRRAYAAAALARLAIGQDSPAALAALADAARHSNPDVRALAVAHLGRVFAITERPPPEALVALLTGVALEDTAFAPRFKARAALRALGRPAPMDHPRDVYKIKLTTAEFPGVERVIAIRADQTLEDLHLAIQQALDWDDDHLYTFYMSGKERDQDYEIPCAYVVTDGDDLFGPAEWIVDEPGDGLAGDAGAPAALPADAPEPPAAEDDEDEGDLPFCAETAVLGELGLPLKHKFLYLFDFGDDHLFTLTVAGVEPRTARARYPRVVERKGAAPPQYPAWDDEDAGEGAGGEVGEEDDEDAGGEAG
jgi:hypothetical protein